MPTTTDTVAAPLTLAVLYPDGTPAWSQDFDAGTPLNDAIWWAFQNTHWARTPGPFPDCGVSPHLMVSHGGGVFVPVAEAVAAERERLAA